MLLFRNILRKLNMINISYKLMEKAKLLNESGGCSSSSKYTHDWFCLRVRSFAKWNSHGLVKLLVSANKRFHNL